MYRALDEVVARCEKTLDVFDQTLTLQGWESRARCDALWAAMKQFAGCFATDVKPQVEFDPPDEPMTRTAFAKLAMQAGVSFPAATLCLYDDEYVFINGDAFVIKGDAHFWRTLADERRVVVTRDEVKETVDSLYAWYTDGLLKLIDG